MARIKLKGLNRVKVKRGDGSYVFYYYAWKGGPRLPDDPGSPEFAAAWMAAQATKAVTKAGTLQSLINGYQESAEWQKLSPRSKSDYLKQILKIEAKFGTFPLSGLSDRRAKGIFKSWRDELAKSSIRQADYAWTVLARILSWAKNDRGMIDVNPCAKGGRLYSNTRADKIWTDADEAAFLASAPKHLHLPLMLALWTGQRQGDLLSLTWQQYDGTDIRLRQNKTGTRVTIPVGKPLKAMLDPIRQRVGTVLLNSDGDVWTADGFRSSFGKARKATGILGVTFNDLRGTAVTRLALCGCTEAEIATLTGHSLRQVRSILDVHYLHRDPELAKSAIRKLERRTKIPK